MLRRCFGEALQCAHAEPVKLVTTKNGYKVKDLTKLSEADRTVRAVQNILNKVTESNFNQLLQEILSMELIDPDVVSQTVNRIFEKALEDSAFCKLYALLCAKLVDYSVQNGPDCNVEGKTFRYSIINKAQTIFKDESHLQAQDDEDLNRIRKRKMANMHFIAELYNLRMLNDKTIGSILNTIFCDWNRDPKVPSEIDAEVGLKLLEVSGEAISHQQGLKSIFGVVEWLVRENKFSKRLVFLYQNLLDLRANGWRGAVHRSATAVGSPSVQRLRAQAARPGRESYAAAARDTATTSVDGESKATRTRQRHYNDGSLYEGEMWFFHPQGAGVLTHANGRVHRGEFADGAPHCTPELSSPYGDEWSGTWHEGTLHEMTAVGSPSVQRLRAQAARPDRESSVAAARDTATTSVDGESKATRTRKMRFNDGSLYEGEMRFFHPHGTGKVTNPNGAVWRGTWYEGELREMTTATTKDAVLEFVYLPDFDAPFVTVKYNDGRRYEGEIQNFLPHGRGMLAYTDGRGHVGEFRDGVPHGTGEVFYPDGDVLSGTWRAGMPSGCMTLRMKDGVREFEYLNRVAAPTGTVKYNDGDRYEGEMKDFNPHGKGALTYADGRVHRGEFRDSVPHGPGRLTYRDGAVLSGTWCKGKRHACMTLTTECSVCEVEYVEGVAAPTGTVKWNDGRRYEGDVNNWKPNGTGVLTHADDGTVHRGEFAKGKAHGPGKLTLPGGDVLSGTWCRGRWHGCMTLTTPYAVQEVEYVDYVAAPTGTVKWNDGCGYEGEMKDWLPHGKGALTYSDGRVHRGKFANGVPHGTGEVTYPDGDVLTGSWRKGNPHGFMKLTTKGSVREVEHVDSVAARTKTVTFNDGRRYEGGMKDWLPHGTGVLTCADSRVLRGEFVDGVPHGTGEVTYPDGDVLTGSWRKGNPHGFMKLTTKGSVREVEYVDGVAAPTGTVTYNDGRRYEGGMKNFEPHGTGVLTEYSVREVEYVDGVAVPTGTVMYNGGGGYEGEIQLFQPHGTGMLTWSDDRVHGGNFVGGEPKGLAPLSATRRLVAHRF